MFFSAVHGVPAILLGVGFGVAVGDEDVDDDPSLLLIELALLTDPGAHAVSTMSSDPTAAMPSVLDRRALLGVVPDADRFSARENCLFNVMPPCKCADAMARGVTLTPARKSC
ncbi:hypothetical protein [Paenarthrobacter sp. NPDC089316]|uniref:hypothetical protein n=1 Tax=unclassified Paenarthrobacter TaxID=2634190 RepID=UPI0034292DF1